jgi:uncharacterized membrane protein (DUF2068 family)
MPSFSAIRFVAFFEGFKGVVVLFAASGILALIHHDVHRLAALLIGHAHLNPASKYPRIFLDAASQLDDPRLWQLAAGAASYSVFRLTEAYGLYRGRAWAELLAAASGALYVPFELLELLRRPSGLVVALLILNLAIVMLMVLALRARRRAARNAGSYL